AQLAQTQQAVEQAELSPQPAVIVRAGDSRADLLVRAAAGLLGRPLWTAAREDPTRQLAELDMRFLLDWQAQRALDDFWGSGSGDPTPYFQTVVDEYLTACRELAQPLGASSNGEKRLAEQTELLVQAAAQGIQTTSKDLLVDDAEPYLIQTTSAALAENLPAGVSALAINFADGQTVPLAGPDQLQTPLSRLPLPVAAQPTVEQLSYAIRNQANLTQQRSLQATVYYRGHAWQSEFFVQPAHGLEIVYEPPRYPAPTVTVFGQARQQASVVFVLDCSGSMMRRLGGIESQGRMIDLARDTLEAILARLIGPDEPFRVGVLVYGHRCGWNPAPGQHTELVVPDPVRRGQFLPAPPDFALHPNSDVESVLPLGAFSERIRRELENRLDALTAMGQTPLYLAIIQAIEAVRKEPQENRLHVVAITDGFNEQTSGGPPDARKFRKDVEDVLTALGNRRVQLDIVGFNLVAKTPNEQTAQQDVIAIATRTGGAFHSAADPSLLLKALEKSLGLVQYTVQPIAARPGATPLPPAAEPTELGQSVIVEQPAAVKRDYRVALVDPERPAAADIVLEGGEAIQLYLAADPQLRQRRLVHHRYDRDLRASAEQASDPLGANRRFFLGAHLPERLGRAVRFPVSIQHADAEQFSPRPVEAWVEIRPRLADRSLGPAYSFYDLTFEADRPVPVLSCLAPAWPENAASAAIRLWFKLSKTEPDLAVPLEQFAAQAVVVEAAPDVRFSLEVPRREKPEDPHQVILTERHPPGSGLDAIKVEIRPSPGRTIHRYSFETATIRHTFVYSAVAAEPMRDARVLLTSRQRLAEGAVALAEPLEVTIPRAAVPLGR
nr:VWA domain-containing protein [Pirellulaceae bacterium]